MRPRIIPLIAQVVEAVYSRDATPTTAVSLAEGATCACAQLSNAYANLTLFGNSTNYVAEATNYWDIRSDLLPECIFLPTNKDQVAYAVNTLTSCEAQFAMRGRGHMNVRDFCCSLSLLFFFSFLSSSKKNKKTSSSSHTFTNYFSFLARTTLTGVSCLP